MTLQIGCIADDFTGGTDVAAALRRSGLSVTLLFDPPSSQTPAPTTDAVVVALKTRTVAAETAVRQSMACLEWFTRLGCRRAYFKYCSTFDSTAAGNIGPVADALADAVGEPLVLMCPASPEHGRTTYQGHLFVHDRLLSESSMRDHPLTPMTDPDLRRVLSAQTERLVGLVPLAINRDGVTAVVEQLETLRESRVAYAIVDATSDGDLDTVAAAAQDARLLTGGAGLAGAVGRVIVDRRPSEETTSPAALPLGRTIVLAGSCSTATLEQVARASAVMPSHRLDPVATPDPVTMLAEATEWLHGHAHEASVLIYSSAAAEARAAGLAAMGPDTSHHLEAALAALAIGAVGAGVVRVVVAGGETSGAVVQALGLDAVEVVDEVDRGVPWCLTPDGRLAVLLKSGNFGGPDLLAHAGTGCPT